MLYAHILPSQELHKVTKREYKPDRHIYCLDVNKNQHSINKFKKETKTFFNNVDLLGLNLFIGDMLEDGTVLVNAPIYIGALNEQAFRLLIHEPIVYKKEIDIFIKEFGVNLYNDFIKGKYAVSYLLDKLDDITCFGEVVQIITFINNSLKIEAPAHLAVVNKLTNIGNLSQNDLNLETINSISESIENFTLVKST